MSGSGESSRNWLGATPSTCPRARQVSGKPQIRVVRVHQLQSSSDLVLDDLAVVVAAVFIDTVRHNVPTRPLRSTLLICGNAPFHCERRERVLLRDILRFGTAI